MMAVDVIPGPGPTFLASETETVFSLNPFENDYDVTRDGRFLMIRRRAADQGLELIVVENWFEELKAMGGNK